MLEELDIKNFALIDSAHVDFTRGFTVPGKQVPVNPFSSEALHSFLAERPVRNRSVRDARKHRFQELSG